MLLFLFHFESLSIGSIKISHLWKGILLMLLIFSELKKKKKQVFIYKPLLFLSALQLINLETINNPFNAVLLFGTTLILPLLGIFVLKYSPKELNRTLLFFSSFFILSFIPYELGLLKSIEDGYTLTSYGVESNGIIGPFQTVHSASTALAAAFLVVLFFWFSKAFNRIYLSFLLVISFYFLIFTYVRTGMLMVVLGAIPMLIYFARKEASTRIRLIFIGGLFSILISAWVLSNETLVDRISGRRANSVESESFENLGSGRGLIYIFAIEIFTEADILEQLIGMGQTEQKNRMEQKIGNKLIPHNGFLLLLLNNGILGLLVFLVFIRRTKRYIKKIKTQEKILSQGLLYAYLIMTFFQNYDMLYMYLILVLSIAFSFNLNKTIKTKVYK